MGLWLEQSLTVCAEDRAGNRGAVPTCSRKGRAARGQKRLALKRARPAVRPHAVLAPKLLCLLLWEPKTDMPTTPARPTSVQGASARVFRLV